MERARVHTGFQLFSICKERATKAESWGATAAIVHWMVSGWRLARPSLNQLKSLPAKVGDKTSADIRAIQCRLPRVNRAPLLPGPRMLTCHMQFRQRCYAISTTIRFLKADPCSHAADLS
jgi:hypothetical protein